MPKMGDSMEEGTLLRWMKREGDTVALDEMIAEVETDKASVEIPSPEAGTISKILVQEGETVAVGAVIAMIGDGASGNGAHAAPAASKPVEKPAEEKATEPEKVQAAEPTKDEPTADAVSHERVKASGLARTIAQQAGIDLAVVTGTGPGGRIVERDIRKAIAQGTTKPVATATASAPTRMPASVTPTADGIEVEVSRMRKAIAKRTTISKQTIPHFYLTMPIEMDKAMALLADMNVQTPDQKVTVNDLIVKACAVALVKLPNVNASYTPDDKLRQYSSVNIGIAVGTENGLTIPVVTNCQTKTLRQISADARTMIGKARNNQLTPQDMSGSTFSVSNLGMFGVEEFSAIINPPDSCILAIGAAMKEVVVAQDGSFEARQRMRVTLSCDHRVVDGVLGAQFLQEVKRLLEAPLNLLA
jgi:pyruvate dehydrogenase E2 component (dihydrolipoamide acetyltransferase)